MLCCCCLVAQLQPHGLYIASWAPLSMEFSSQEYCNRLPFLSPGDLPNPGIQPASPALAGGFFTTVPPEKHFQDATAKYSSEESSVSIFMCFSGGSEWTVVLAATNSTQFKRQSKYLQSKYREGKKAPTMLSQRRKTSVCLVQKPSGWKLPWVKPPIIRPWFDFQVASKASGKKINSFIPIIGSFLSAG